MRNIWKYALAVAVALGVLTSGVAVGSSSIGMKDVFAIIAHQLFGAPLPSSVSVSSVTILWTLRLPRVLVAFTVGGALAVSGCVVQSVLKNPLATPHTLGVSSGASLGAGLVIVSGLTIPAVGGYTLPVTGFICSLLTVALVLSFASGVDRGMSGMTVILAGMVFSLFFNAVLTVLTALSRNNIERITLWQMGSFSMRGWDALHLLTPFLIVGFTILILFCRELDIMTFGEDSAQSIGVAATRVKWIIFICAAVLTGASVSLCGTVGFVDLIAPHLARRWFGSRHRILLPMCAITGGVLTVASDLAARTLMAPSELPVGAVTAIIGAPFFAYVYFNKMR